MAGGYVYPFYNVPQYPGLSSFPTPSGAAPLSLAIDQNTDYLYMWDLASSVWRLLSAPGGSSIGYTTTATAAGTTTLTVTSTGIQAFTGTTTQTVVLPVTSTLVLGQQFTIINSSSGVVTVQSSGANTIQAMAASSVAIITCISLSGTGTSSWQLQYYSNINATPTASVAAAWDANKNMSAQAFIPGYQNVTSAAGTTTLVVGSPGVTYISGSTTQSVVLPVTSTLALGMQYYVINGSSGAVTVKSSGANSIQVLQAGAIGIYTCILLSGTGTSSWQASLGPIGQGYSGLPTGAGQYLGTNTNDTATAGNIGEYIENSLAAGSAVSITSGAATDLDSGGGSPVGIVLTAGCWDISFNASFIVAASTSVTKLSAWVGTATGDSTTGQDLAKNYSAVATAANVMSGTQTLCIAPYRVTLSGSQTYYLKGTGTFSVSTMTGYGTIRATRVR